MCLLARAISVSVFVCSCVWMCVCGGQQQSLAQKMNSCHHRSWLPNEAAGPSLLLASPCSVRSVWPGLLLISCPQNTQGPHYPTAIVYLEGRRKEERQDESEVCDRLLPVARTFFARPGLLPGSGGFKNTHRESPSERVMNIAANV